jgi:MarR family transcriptional regulator, organic hydroperoxide resistance regulator
VSPDKNPLGSRHAGPKESPGLLLWQLAMRWQQALRPALAALDLTHAQFVLLASAAYLGSAEEGTQPTAATVTQKLLADHARLDAVTTSEVLRTLEAKGLVERRPHPGDARARAVAVTKAGKALARKAIPAVEAADAAYFREHAAEIATLAHLVDRGNG